MIALALAAATAWCPAMPRAEFGAGAWQDPPPAPAHVHTEGTLPGDPAAAASQAAERGLPTIQRAAWTWRETGDPAWRDRARGGLMDWVRHYQPDLNPIDETPLDPLIETYAILEPELGPDDRAAARAFFGHWAAAYLAAMRHADRQAIWINNWQSHRVKLVTMIAFALGDPALIDEARRVFRQQLAANMHADGEVLDFAQRDALHYVVYDLEPLLRAALVARAHGEDWFTMPAFNGASLAAGVRWLRPYAAGERTHQEFVRSRVRFDAERAAVGVPGFTGRFDPHRAAGVFWMASRFDPAFLPLAEQLGRQPAFLARCGA